MSRKGRTGGDEWVHLKDESSVTVSGLSCRRHWLTLGGPFPFTFA